MRTGGYQLYVFFKLISDINKNEKLNDMSVAYHLVSLSF